MRRTYGLPIICMLASLAGPAAPDETDGVSWQDAVAELAAEKTRAETCASLAKQNIDAASATFATIQMEYGSAKAEMDAIIGGLVVVLAVEEEPVTLASLQERLETAVALRDKFCETTVAMLPTEEGEQTRNLVGDILGKALGALISAIKDIYIYHQEEDVLERKTIQTQVEATRWRAFSDIPG